MKAALFEGPHRLHVAEKPLRPLQDEEVLIKVESCGVCGTDVHIVEGTSRSNRPVVLGHEYAGLVEEVGRNVTGVDLGRRVAIDPNISCRTCYYCRRGLVHLCSNLRALGVDIDGGMAEYCIVPATQAYALPEGMSPEACAFIEPVSCVLHGIDRAKIQSGDTVVIVGAGTMGLIMLQFARNAGATQVIVVEPLEHKREIAKKLGADEVISPSESDVRSAVFDLTGVGADVVIECAGKAQAVELALELVRRGGVVELFGVCPIGEKIPIEPNQVYFKELKIVGSYINPNTFSRAISVLHSGLVLIDLFQIDRFPLDAVHEALDFQRTGKTIATHWREV